MTTTAILLMIVAATAAGDYLIKAASLNTQGIASARFMAGAALYALPAIGWFFLMKSHTLATIGIIYSCSNILVLFALGYFVFKEAVTARELTGIGLAVAAILVLHET